MQNNIDYLIDRHPKTEIDEEKISLFESRDGFCELSVELFKEITSLILTISSVERIKNNKVVPYNKEEAALFGNLVRYLKISSAYLEQFTRKRAEICMILFRSLAETYINLKYFLKFKDQHTISHYIKHSLRQEKMFLEHLRENGGQKPELAHIEQRMTESILRSYADSGFTEEEVKNSSRWDEKIKKRINEIIDPSFYILYGNSSHSVHGNWQDLLFFHLKKVDDGFLQKHDWFVPNVQLLAPVTLISCDLLKEFSQEVLPDSEQKKELLDVINDIFMRTIKLDVLHEKFVQKNWPNDSPPILDNP